MKKLLFIAVLLFATNIQAQEKKKSAKLTFEVNGVCEMCKSRIEKAALKTKGVKFCSWNLDTHQLSLIIDERKTSKAIIQKNIAAIGHDTKEFKATEEAYNNLHNCCHYDRTNFPYTPEK